MSPRDNRLLVSASTASNPDLGAQSEVVWNHHDWVHLTFVFENFTAPSKRIDSESDHHIYIDSDSTSVDRLLVLDSKGDILVTIFTLLLLKNQYLYLFGRYYSKMFHITHI